jgi:acetolactate synthase-1/2/3 large subunit
MTGLELLTARHFGVPVIVVVLRDRQLAQIAQFQKRAFVRRTSSDISDFDLGALCRAIGLEHLLLARDNDAIRILEIAKDVHGKGRPIVVESIMDDSFRTYFTQGVLRTNFGRLPWGDRLRFVARVAGRKMSNLV